MKRDVPVVQTKTVNIITPVNLDKGIMQLTKEPTQNNLAIKKVKKMKLKARSQFISEPTQKTMKVRNNTVPAGL